MTAPREIVAGSIHMITRRCTQRMFLLKPDGTTNQIFAYCLAEAAKRYNIGVIAWLVMSNHYHAIVYDPDGVLPAFTAHLHKMVAKALNVRWDRWENLWSSEETCVTRLVTMEDVFDKVVYTLTNPIKANLVDRVADWPGHSSLSYMGNNGKSHKRPKTFFSSSGVMPESRRLRAIQPPMLPKSETYQDWVKRVREAVTAAELTARDERLRTGKKLVGRKRVLDTHPTSAPPKATRHRKLRPALACLDKDRRILELGKLKAFRIAYREARLRFIKGERDVKFPAGTYQLRALKVRCLPRRQPN